ncbi:alpha/beta fold hydrolase [Streptomyces sp. NPDC088732]|uniref:alpha/beta fold hydrolase n=1 Tax=Streptomyces sp. NPDC088732 TaxID=3365879 RepID=UPI0037F8439B
MIHARYPVNVEGSSTPVPGRREGEILTDDGVRLRYQEAGSGNPGHPLVLVPGFGQTAAGFAAQIDGLGRHRRVIALDQRGHGRSERPAHGYRASRLAMDLHQVLEGLDLRDATLLGHSLGCSVLWCHWDLFGSDRTGRLVLVDQSPVVSSEFAGAGQEAPPAAVFTRDMTLGFAAGLRGGPDAVDAVVRAVVAMLHSPSLGEDEVRWLVEQTRLLPPRHAADLLLDHYANDWRDVLPRITVPALVIGGELSFLPPGTTEWVASLIPGARARVFSADEAGSHLMFRENPALFNRVVADFLDSVE